MPATILVVDDDVSTVTIIKDSLEMDNYRVICGYDGQMALHLARTQKPTLIIMDVNMPITNGLNALKFLRAAPETRNIPVIFLTGEASGTVYPSLDKYQRVFHLKKPLDLDHLRGMVQHVLATCPAV